MHNLLDPEKKFSHAELNKMEGKAAEMFNSGAVEVHCVIGNHQICLKRENKDAKTIQVHKMDTMLEKNEEIVNLYNNRKKK